jgi:hypothetical protein
MRHSKPFIALLLFLSAFPFPGCHTSHASPSAASLAKPSAAPSSAPSFAHPSKHPPRDSEFSVYHNPGYGISFRYPRNYPLLEGLEAEDSLLLHHQQELSAAQPGIDLVAAVVIPGDAYPNTTFLEGHLQFAINPGVSEPACRSFTQNSIGAVTLGKTLVEGIPFYWRQYDPPEPGTAYTQRDYAGFSNGNCYEFFLEVATTANDTNEGPSSPADVAKALRPLEKSVSSLQVHPVSRPQ